MPNPQNSLKKEIIAIGKKLYALRLVSGRAGNLSARSGKINIFITARGTCLGELKPQDIIRVNLANKVDIARKRRQVSSEFPLHRLIYQNFTDKVVIHCHPPLTNAYFSIYPKLKTLTFESKFYLGEVPVVGQRTLTITRPREVIRALETNKIVVVKNHGVVSIADNFKEALYLIEVLEETVKIAAVAALLKKGISGKLDKAIRNYLR
jgi:ribulose-5-phosphate 4-epimerase/fuculose-1-phosphate aldolase